MKRFFYIGTKHGTRDLGYLTWVEERIRNQPGETEGTFWVKGFTTGPDYPSEEAAVQAAERMLGELFPDDEITVSCDRSLV